MTATEVAELEMNLAQFYGTSAYYRFSILSNLVLTDGTKYLAEVAGAYWLMDLIASYQKKCMKDEMLRDFQIWTLKVENQTGVVTCERDTDDVAFRQEIPFTDFPLESIKIYCENGVIYLPSER